MSMTCCLLIIPDLLRTIKDPEKPNSLDDLNVILDDSVRVLPLSEDGYLVKILVIECFVYFIDF